MPHRLFNILGAGGAGFTVITLIEKLTPLLQFFGLIAGIVMMVTAICLNLQKLRGQNKQNKILDKLNDAE